MKKLAIFSVLFAGILFVQPVMAEDSAYVITLKDQVFSPETLEIPAGQRVEITVKNLGTAPAEFESHAMNSEKILPANSEVKVFIGPLQPGTYEYFDDFHSDASKGAIKAVAAEKN